MRDTMKPTFIKYWILALLVTGVFLAQCGQGPSIENSNNNVKEIVDVIDYYDNGVVRIQGKTLNGKRDGRWEAFYPSGLRWSHTTYRDGYKEGETVSFYPNGMMRYNGYYYNDERSGIWQFYDTLGYLVLRIDLDEPLSGTDSLLLKNLDTP